MKKQEKITKSAALEKISNMIKLLRGKIAYLSSDNAEENDKSWFEQHEQELNDVIYSLRNTYIMCVAKIKPRRKKQYMDYTIDDMIAIFEMYKKMYKVPLIILDSADEIIKDLKYLYSYTNSPLGLRACNKAKEKEAKIVPLIQNASRDAICAFNIELLEEIANSLENELYTNVAYNKFYEVYNMSSAKFPAYTEHVKKLYSNIDKIIGDIENVCRYAKELISNTKAAEDCIVEQKAKNDIAKTAISKLDEITQVHTELLEDDELY